MKIVTLITRMIRGGAQRIALEIAVELTRRGHDAPLWCGPETGPEGSLLEEAAARGVRLRIFPRLRRAVEPTADLRALADLRSALRAERPDWLHTHSSKAGILGREAGRSAGVPRIAHTVHGWGFTPQTPPALRALYVALERRQAADVRQAAGRAGRRDADLGATPGAASEIRRRLLFVNETDRAEGVRLGILPPGAGTVIPPGIDLAPFRDLASLSGAREAIRRDCGWGAEVAVGGFFGRLAAQKDPTTLLEAAALLGGEFPRLRWLVVGDGPLARILRARVESDGRLRGRIRFGGLQSESRPWLAAMDFLFFPSLWEGAPLTILEAMAAGTPLVASDLPGVRGLLEPGASSLPDSHTGKPERGDSSPREPVSGGAGSGEAVSGEPRSGEPEPGSKPMPVDTPDSPAGESGLLGLLATPGNAAAFAARVRELLQGPEGTARRAEAARQHAFRHFGLESMLARMLRVYEE